MRRAAPRALRRLSRLLAPLILIAPVVPPLPRAALAKSASTQASRSVEIVLPLRDGPFLVGEIRSRSSADGNLQVESEPLIQILRSILRPDSLTGLQQATSGKPFVSVAALNEGPVKIVYDPIANELHLDVAPSAREPQSVSIVGNPDDARPHTLAEPSVFSAFANVRSNIDYIGQEPDGGDTGPQLPAGTLDGAIRVGGPVLEGESTFNGGDWYRRGTRAVFDLPEDVLRLRAGDLFFDRTGFQNSEDIAGVSVSRIYNELAPGRNVRPTGRRTLRIERPSDVEIFVNDRPMRRLRLQPGTYDIRDFTFFSGDNNIQIIVEDDTGRREIIDYSLFFSRELLEPGLDEFAIYAGIEAPPNENEPDYRPNKPLASGFYRRGLSENLTAGINLQGDTHACLMGISGLLATPFGTFNADVAGSQRDGNGLGLALAFQWELLNFTFGPPGQNSLRTSLESRTANFGTISSDELSDVSNPFIVDLGLSSSRELGPRTSATFSTRYAVARDDRGDSYGADMTLSQQLGLDWLFNATVGYNRTGDGSSASRDDSILGNGISAFLSVSYAIEPRSRARATYDTRNNRTNLTYARYGGESNNSYSLDAQLERTDDDTSLSGNATYYGNRGEIGLTHTAGITKLDGDTLANRASVRPAFSLAYAGGQAAMGRPILNSFALVGTTANLDDRTVVVGPRKGDEEGRSGWLMPATIWDLSPYSPRRLTYDVDRLPVGYDLGAGAFDLNPPYKSGYALTVGSDYNVTVIGTVLDPEGEAIALTVGEAKQIENGERSVSVFTNRRGRFVAQGIGPGRWRIRMDTSPPLDFELNIPENAVGLFRAGDLRPIAGESPFPGGPR